LAISKRLAELMGGEVGVDSEKGVGSTFWFTARLARSDMPCTRVLTPEPDLRGLRVLVVDDNSNARAILAEMLRSMTFVVEAVPSGDAALHELAEAITADRPFEIVFVDWQMPGMDGMVVANKIRRLGLARPPHLVMITAFDREEVRKAAGEAGFEAFLVKPVSPSLLFNTAMQVLSVRGVEPDLADLSAAEAPGWIPSIAGARVLLVEDNDLNQEVATELLRDIGLQVDLAEDGAVAVSKAMTERYDLVLMDMQMPVMDGLTATRQIRKLPQCADLPVIAMTANALVGYRDRCLEAGMNDYITKPIEPGLLRETLLRWITPRGGTGSPLLSPIAADEMPLEAVLEAIPGLDTGLGLRAALDRPSLYRSLLHKFVKSQRDFEARFGQALAGADWSSAERLAHTLKGTSAQIGALDLRDAAQRLERAIHQREPGPALDGPIADLVADAASLLEPLLLELSALLPDEPSAALETEADPISLAELATKLDAMLARDDFACTQLVEENRGLLSRGLGERFAAFAEAIESFDFASARELLEKV
jgi:two-component system sensor histidine kinase/response regulator